MPTWYLHNHSAEHLKIVGIDLWTLRILLLTYYRNHQRSAIPSYSSNFRCNTSQPQRDSHSLGLNYAVIFGRSVHNHFTLTRIVAFDYRRYHPGWQHCTNQRPTVATELLMPSQRCYRTLRFGRRPFVSFDSGTSLMVELWWKSHAML